MKYAYVGLNVTNLEKSIEFYSKLFGVEPVKVKPDYAKFLLETPGLYFTLNHRDEVKGSQVGHFGFQVESTEEVIAHKNRLAENGILSLYDEINTTCCTLSKINFGFMPLMVTSGSSSIQKQMSMLAVKMLLLVVFQSSLRP
jgi:hypothetical protein